MVLALTLISLFLLMFNCPLFVFASSDSLHCYSCSTIDADRLMAEVRDPIWRSWLEQVRMVPRTAKCADSFRTVSALRHGVRSQPCADGICLKLWFRDYQQKGDGDGHVWRWCARNVQGRLREDCTHITSSKGELEVCTCDGNLCNGAAMDTQIAVFLLLMAINLILFL